jgi:polysaccharide export outer membrane protein
MESRRGLLEMLALAATGLLGGCALPVSGPQSWDITSGQSDPKNLVYGLVKITPRTVAILAENDPQIAGEFADRRGPETLRFGIGDILSITIFESGPGGLFTPPESVLRTGNYVTLPPQSVDDRGYITVPYAGPMRARGRTAMELQQAIIDALKNAALKPQVVVSLMEQRASAFTVLGEVSRAGRFPVLASGERILDAIARAGGLTGAGNESWVVFERGGRRALVPFGAIVDVPANNIYVRANDLIYVFREPQTFLAFGAVGSGGGGGVGGVTLVVGGAGGARGGQFAFGAWRITLSEALAKANGLNDAAADPASVFLYRGETRPVAELLGVDVSKFDGPIIPIIYNIDLRNPAGFFLASKFEMRNKDVIYVSNASAVETSKFLTFINLIVNTANDPISAANGAYALKAAISGTAATPATIVSTAAP